METCDHFAFEVADLDRAIAFYTDKLGFDLHSREINNSEGEEFACVSIGSICLNLVKNIHQGYTPPDIHPPYCPHIALATPNLARLLSRLRQNGVTILHGPLLIENEAAWLYIADPDHNIIKYVQWLRRL